jgi:dTDP-D-glucose 4,6-dehydratase
VIGSFVPVPCFKVNNLCADYCATTNNLNSVKELPNFKFVRGCIQSFDLVAHILESEEIDTVMHFAAQVNP